MKKRYQIAVRPTYPILFIGFAIDLMLVALALYATNVWVESIWARAAISIVVGFLCGADMYRGYRQFKEAR